jgi:hypothetical protein
LEQSVIDGTVEMSEILGDLVDRLDQRCHLDEFDIAPVFADRSEGLVERRLYSILHRGPVDVVPLVRQHDDEQSVRRGLVEDRPVHRFVHSHVVKRHGVEIVGILSPVGL